MPLLILRDGLIFVAALTGLGLPLWRWLGWTRGVELLSLALAGALLIGYLGVFGFYIAAVSLRWFWNLPALGWIYLILRPGALRETRSDPEMIVIAGAGALILYWRHPSSPISQVAQQIQRAST